MDDFILKLISACHTGIGKRGVLDVIFSTHGTGGLWSQIYIINVYYQCCYNWTEDIFIPYSSLMNNRQ